MGSASRLTAAPGFMAARAVRFTGTTDADGLVKVPGAAALTGVARKTNLGTDEEYEAEREGGSSSLYVVAREGDDLSLVQGDWREGLYSWNFNLPETSARLGGLGHQA